MPTDVQAENVPAMSDPSVALPPRPLRLWLPLSMLALFWALYVSNDWLEMSMFARFMSRLAANALLTLGFLAWWLSRRAIGWGERLQALAVFIVGSIVVLYVADPSLNAFSIFLGASSIVYTAWMIAFLLMLNRASAARCSAVAVAILLVLSPFTLIRWDGIDGAQHGEYSWRWRPTSEQLFLASHAANVTAEPIAATAPWTLQPADVPGFRGAQRDSVASGAKLDLDWSAHAPKQLWRQRLGPGWSSLIVVDGHVVTQEQREESEVVACYDATNGKEIWVHADPVRFFEGLSGAGPRGTPEFADGRVYAVGGRGNLNCLDAATGKLLWSHDLEAEAAATVPQWGFAVSPLVVDGKVIVFAPGKESAGLMTYDAATGELKWKLASGGDTYSSPQLVELGGMRQILMQDGRALFAVNPADGTRLWEIANANEMAVPMLQPRAVGDGQLLFFDAGGLSLVQVRQQNGKWTTAEKWVSNRLRPNFNDLVTHKGKIYGLDDGILCALDLKTGERLWKKGRYGHGQLLLLADRDALVVLGARGEITLVAIDRDEPRVLGAFQAIDGKTWNHPALVANRLYVRNGEEIACYELPAQQ
jgi:outer membrane protein assembly factor BamB